MAPASQYAYNQLMRDFEALQNSGSPIAHLVTLKSNKARYGFNDGAIYPKGSYPQGTPEKVMRAEALNKEPLRGKVKICVVLVDFPDKRFNEERNSKAHYEVGLTMSTEYMIQTNQ
jgi:immune inhibitor A